MMSDLEHTDRVAEELILADEQRERDERMARLAAEARL